MKSKRFSFISLLLALALLLGMPAGCKTAPQDTKSKGASNAGSAASETGSGESGAASDVSEASGASQSATSQTNPGASSKSSGPAVSAPSEVTVSGSTKFGVNSTRKMPNYLSKINSPILKILSSDKPTDKSIAETAKAFKAVTGKDIIFEYTVVEWNSLPDRLAIMVKSGSPPDLMKYYSNTAPFLVQKPYWEDLNKYIDISDALWKVTQSSNPEYFSFKGKRMAVLPVGPSSGTSFANGYYYNVALVKEAISGNKSLYDPVQMFKDGKWTWNTLYQFAEEITTDADNDGVPEIYGHVMEGSRVNAFIGAAGQDIVKIGADGKMTYNLENPDVLRALNFAKKLGKLSNHPAPWDGLKDIIAKKAGFYFASIWWSSLSSASLEAKKKNQIAFVPFPRDPNTNITYMGIGGDAYFVSLGAKNPYLAGAYLYFRQYSSYNPNPALVKQNEDVMRDERGFNDQDIAFVSGKVKIGNVKYITTGIGERIDGFNMAQYHKDAFNPGKLVSKTVEELAPGLKAAITRYNNAK